MIIENVRVKSCRVDEPNDNDKFQLIFAIDDKKKRKELIKMIDDDWEENKGKLKNKAKKPANLGYFESEPSDDFPDDEDTGTMIFIATRNATTKAGKEQKVPVFKANGNEYEETPNIGSGSIINLSTDTYTWEYKKNGGTKLNLNKIQVMELHEFSGGDTFGNASGSSFGGEDFTKLDKAIKKGKAEKAQELFDELKDEGADKAELKKRKKLIKAL